MKNYSSEGQKVQMDSLTRSSAILPTPLFIHLNKAKNLHLCQTGVSDKVRHNDMGGRDLTLKLCLSKHMSKRNALEK